MRLLVVMLAVILAGCSTGDFPRHPKAVVSRDACPPEAMEPGDTCLHIPEVPVNETVSWYRDALTARGWTKLEVASDDEPFQLLSLKGDRIVVLIVQRHEGGTALQVKSRSKGEAK